MSWVFSIKLPDWVTLLVKQGRMDDRRGSGHLNVSHTGWIASLPMQTERRNHHQGEDGNLRGADQNRSLVHLSLPLLPDSTSEEDRKQEEEG